MRGGRDSGLALVVRDVSGARGHRMGLGVLLRDEEVEVAARVDGTDLLAKTTKEGKM